MNRLIMEQPAVLPRARTAKQWRFSFFWLVPLLALGFLAYLLRGTFLGHGPTIEIRFSQVDGLEPGRTEVRFRGAKIGSVTDLKLAKDLTGVDVTIVLDKAASAAANRGTAFWIVHPEVTAGEIRGLGAIVSGSYIEAKPGQGEPVNHFVGLDQPPALVYDRPGLTVFLLTERLTSLQKGSGVYYRGVQVGQVISHELASDAQTVRLEVHIDQEFAPLVRETTKFWNGGGIHAKLGILGANIRADSLKTLISGGIDIATPDVPGQLAKEGSVFRLYDQGEAAWERWTPAINLPYTHPMNETKPPTALSKP